LERKIPRRREGRARKNSKHKGVQIFPHEIDGKKATTGSKGTYVFKDDGLIKKTISILMNGLTHHLICYYTKQDLTFGTLHSPRSFQELCEINIGSDLYTHQNFRKALTAGPNRTIVEEAENQDHANLNFSDSDEGRYTLDQFQRSYDYDHGYDLEREDSFSSFEDINGPPPTPEHEYASNGSGSASSRFSDLSRWTFSGNYNQENDEDLSSFNDDNVQFPSSLPENLPHGICAQYLSHFSQFPHPTFINNGNFWYGFYHCYIVCASFIC
jgi:hypothetical protein